MASYSVNAAAVRHVRGLIEGTGQPHAVLAKVEREERDPHPPIPAPTGAQPL